MDRFWRIGGQVALYALFAAFIGFFSTSPGYSLLAPEQGLLRLSFKHPGKIGADCRTRTPEELAKLQPQMRAAQDCQRERSPVQVQVELDGAMLVNESFAPAGLSRDGAASGYRRIPIAAGRHSLRVRFDDDVRNPAAAVTRDANVDVKPGQVVLIDFNPEREGVVIR
jgi:hypothetical protein